MTTDLESLQYGLFQTEVLRSGMETFAQCPHTINLERIARIANLLDDVIGELHQLIKEQGEQPCLESIIDCELSGFRWG